MTGEYTASRIGHLTSGTTLHQVYRNGVWVGIVYISAEIPFDGELANAVADTFYEHEARVSGDVR